MDRLVETEDDRRSFIRWIEKWMKLPSTVTIRSGRQRSLDQNALMWKWAEQASDQRPGTTAREIQNEWKRIYGIPLRCVESAEFAVGWALIEAQYNYEQQLELMPIIAVSSQMTVTTFSTFLDEIWRANATEGIVLSDPEEMRSGTTRATPGRGVDRRNAAGQGTAVGKATRRPAPGRKVR